MHYVARDACCSSLYLAKEATTARVVPSTTTKTKAWCFIWLVKCIGWKTNPIQDPIAVHTINGLTAFTHKVCIEKITLGGKLCQKAFTHGNCPTCNGQGSCPTGIQPQQPMPTPKWQAYFGTKMVVPVLQTQSPTAYMHRATTCQARWNSREYASNTEKVWVLQTWSLLVILFLSPWWTHSN